MNGEIRRDTESKIEVQKRHIVMDHHLNKDTRIDIETMKIMKIDRGESR